MDEENEEYVGDEDNVDEGEDEEVGDGPPHESVVDHESGIEETPS